MSKKSKPSHQKISRPVAATTESAVVLEERQLDGVHGGSGGGAGKSSFSDISFTTSANKTSSA